MASFREQERLRQIVARKKGAFPGSRDRCGVCRGREYEHILPTDTAIENMAASIRDITEQYFSHHNIAWHNGANNLLSSQICCINHLMPFATEPVALARLLQPVFGSDIQMLPISGESPATDRPWFVGFEWAGLSDYLGEWAGARPTRGRNCTSTDAIVRMRRGRFIETVLIEWKYTEAYGDHGPRRGDDERERRYRHLLEASNGPLKAGVDIPFSRFLVEPFYQFMRQQLLAQEMERARELNSDIVRVLHLAPRANRRFASVPVKAFRPFGATATQAWGQLLAQPDRFVSKSIEDLFGPSVHSEAVSLLAYAHQRYRFTNNPET